MPVPLEGSTGAEDAISRAERATRRALARPDIHQNITGELQVHPAVEVNPPTAAGLPWTVDMRFMVRVEPLSQWMVERAIRVAILDEFWDEYGSARGLLPLADGTSNQRPTPYDPAYPPTERMAPVAGPETGSGAADSAPEDSVSGSSSGDDPAASEDDSAETDEPRTVFNGLMRISTMWLIVGFTVALVVRGMMLTPDADDAANSGVLAPPPRTTVATSEVEPTNVVTQTPRKQTPTVAETSPTPAPSATTEPSSSATSATETTTETVPETSREAGAAVRSQNP